MKLLKVLAEEFPMFNNFAGRSHGQGAEDVLDYGDLPAGGEGGEEEMGYGAKPDDDENGCDCQCPCCQKARAEGYGNHEGGEEEQGGDMDLLGKEGDEGSEDLEDDEFNFGV